MLDMKSPSKNDNKDEELRYLTSPYNNLSGEASVFQKGTTPKLIETFDPSLSSTFNKRTVIPL